MEGMKNLTAVEKLEMIRSLTKNMEEQKGQLVKQAPKPAPAGAGPHLGLRLATGFDTLLRKGRPGAG